MANRKQPYKWGAVSAGDIISFKYKSEGATTSKFQTILVLNPFMRRRAGKTEATKTRGRQITAFLIGIKIEQSNKLLLNITQKQVKILEQIGKLRPLDDSKSKINLYRLDIQRRFIFNDLKGIKKRAYELISKSLGITGQYRTYDYYKAIRSSVYLEPIRVMANIKTEEDDGKPKELEPPKQPKPPKQPDKPKGD